jgi:hypothetical protein
MKKRPKRAKFGKGMDFSEEYAILEIKISLMFAKNALKFCKMQGGASQADKRASCERPQTHEHLEIGWLCPGGGKERKASE